MGRQEDRRLARRPAGAPDAAPLPLLALNRRPWPRPWREDGPALLGLLALVLVFNPGLAGGMVLGGYDTFVYFYPLRAYFAQAVGEGRLPLWNPDLFLGVPFLANPQAAVFYPGTLLFALLDVPHAYVVNFLGHVYLAGGSLYLFARVGLGLSRWGSFLGGAAFAFSGFLAGQAGHLNQLSAAAWLPLLALALVVALRRRSRLAYALLAGGLSLQLLAGHPQIVYMTLIVLGVVSVWARVPTGPRSVAHGLGALAVAAGLAFGIAAIQLLPTAELARLSIRGGGLDYQQAADGSLPWQLLLPALFPGYWTHLHTSEFFGHLGAIVLALGWLGLLAGAARPAALGGLLVTLGLVLAVGDTTPLYHALFDWAPGFGAFRVPARWLLVYTFGAAILVAVGASWLTRHQVSADIAEAPELSWERGRPARPGAGGTPALAGGAMLSWFRTPRTHAFGLALPLALAALVFLGQRQSRWLLLIWGGLVLLALLVATGATLLPRLRVPALGVLIACGLAELWVANRDLEHRHPIPDFAYRQPRESTGFLQSRTGLDGPFRILSIATPEYEVKETPEYRERFGRLHPEALRNLLVAVKWNEALIPNITLEYGLPSADGYDGGVLPLANFATLAAAMLPDRARPDGVLASRLDHLPEAGWLDLFGIRYVLAGRIKDLTRDGLYYDRAITRTLRPGERFELRGLPLGAFTRLGMLSSFRGPSRPGQEVGHLELRGEGSETKIPLLDGVHTAVGEAPGHVTAGESLEPVPEWGAGDFGDATDWLTQLRFPHQPVTSLTIANTSPDLVLEVRALNLVDDVRQASFSLTLDDTVERTEFFDMKVYERRDALPRAYLVARAIVLDDPATTRRLGEPGFDPRLGALLAPSEAARPLGTASSDAGFAEIELSQPEHVRIRTNATGASYLVLSDSWYPGWVATVDGRETPIARANVLFRAVEVPAGEHSVDFRYRPTSFLLGAGISALSAIVGLGWWLVAARRDRRKSM